jgi:hypothetical protein
MVIVIIITSYCVLMSKPRVFGVGVGGGVGPFRGPGRHMKKLGLWSHAAGRPVGRSALFRFMTNLSLILEDVFIERSCMSPG